MIYYAWYDSDAKRYVYTLSETPTTGTSSRVYTYSNETFTDYGYVSIYTNNSIGYQNSPMGIKESATRDSTHDITIIKYISNLSDGTETYAIKDVEARTTLGNKQDTLISGTNVKTINNESILGSGNISISASPTFTYDSTNERLTIS